MTTRKVQPRQMWRPPKAADENAKAAAADAYRRGPDGKPERQQPVDTNVVTVKNSSGAARRQFECLELSSTKQLTAVTREQIWCNGIEPTGGTIPFAVLLQPVASTAWTEGQVAGTCPALVNIQSTSHRRAYLPDGEYVLKSSPDGPVKIVQCPTSTGEQLCVVLLTHVPTSAALFKTWKYGLTGIHVTSSNIVHLPFYPASPSTAYTHPANATFLLPGFTDDGVAYIAIGTSGWYHVSVNLMVLLTTGTLAGPVTVLIYFPLQDINNPTQEINADGELGTIQTFSKDTYGGYVTASRTNVAYLTSGYRLKCVAQIGPQVGDYNDLMSVFAELTIGPLVTTVP